MRKTGMIVLLVMCLFCSLVSLALAADQWHELSVQDALDSSLGQEKLRPDISIYMKGQSHPKVLKKLGELKDQSEATHQRFW